MSFLKGDLTNQAKSRDWDQRSREYFCCCCLFPIGGRQVQFSVGRLICSERYTTKRKCADCFGSWPQALILMPLSFKMYASLIVLDHVPVSPVHQREISYLFWSWLGNEASKDCGETAAEKVVPCRKDNAVPWNAWPQLKERLTSKAVGTQLVLDRFSTPNRTYLPL
jgi:hypothetical protein